jgi:hypothetical protein
MGVAAEGNPLCVGVEDYAVRSHPGRSNPVAQLVGSVRDSEVGDCNHGEARVYHIHPRRDIRDEEESGIGKGRDMELALLRVAPRRNEMENEMVSRKQQRTSATHVT